VQLGQRMAQNPNTSLFASLTVQSCDPTQIRTTAKDLIVGWNKLVDNRQTRHATGAYRWLEVTSDENQPWLENVHVHGVLAMSPAYSGRNYLSSADWQELWHASIGSAYRSADVTKIRTPAAVAGYVAALDKFIAAAEIGAREPERHITRTEQMKGLPRYRGIGILGDGAPIEGIWADDGWKRGMRQLDRRINHPGYVPIPIEHATM
jgi:hypothetical protein